MVGVAVNFNCTRCRLEIVIAVPRPPAQQAVLRVDRLEIDAGEAGRKGCRVLRRCGTSVTGEGGRNESGKWVGAGEVPGRERPAAREERPRWCMSGHRAPSNLYRVS